MPLQWRSMVGTDGVGRFSFDNLVLQLSTQQHRMDDALHSGCGDGTDGGFETYRRMARGVATAQRDDGWGEAEAMMIV